MTKRLANHYAAWMQDKLIERVTLREGAKDVTQFGKRVERLRSTKRGRETEEEVWVLLRPGTDDPEDG